MKEYKYNYQSHYSDSNQASQNSGNILQIIEKSRQNKAGTISVIG